MIQCIYMSNVFTTLQIDGQKEVKMETEPVSPVAPGES